MQRNEFQSTLYRSQVEMLDGIAYAWMTAGGWNTPEMLDDLLAAQGTVVSSDHWAMECIREWGLHEPADDIGDGPVPSHMQLNGYTQDDLSDAIRRFVEERPDREEAE